MYTGKCLAVRAVEKIEESEEEEMTKKIAEIQEEENQALKRYLLSHRLILGIFLFCFCSSAHSCKYLLKKKCFLPLQCNFIARA